AADLVRREAGHVAAVEDDGSRRRLHAPRQQVVESGLAGAVRADQRDGLVRLYVQIDAVDRTHPAEALRQPAHREQRRDVARRTRPCGARRPSGRRHRRLARPATIVPKMPRRKKITSTASTTPRNSIHRSVYVVIHVSSSTKIAAPKNGPRK